jgi:hypothetical protein
MCAYQRTTCSDSRKDMVYRAVQVWLWGKYRLWHQAVQVRFQNSSGAYKKQFECAYVKVQEMHGLRDSSSALTWQFRCTYTKFMKYTNISAALMRQVWAVQVRFYSSSIVYSDKFKYMPRAVQYSVFTEHPRFSFKSDLILPSRAVQLRFCGSSCACYKKFKYMSRQFNTLFTAGRKYIVLISTFWAPTSSIDDTKATYVYKIYLTLIFLVMHAIYLCYTNLLSFY